MCASTSYLTHNGERALRADIELANSLRKNGHMSPLQHPARPREDGDPENASGNYGSTWTQLRKLIKNEGDFTKFVSEEDLLVGCRGDHAMVNFILSLAE